MLFWISTDKKTKIKNQILDQRLTKTLECQVCQVFWDNGIFIVFLIKAFS